VSNKGAHCILDVGWKALSTYNSSSANGVQKYRAVKVGSTIDTIDLNVAATTLALGVVQEDIDATKVATGKAVANVRYLGVTKMVVQTAASIVEGSLITCGNAGGAVIAASTNKVIGICVGTPGTVAAGDYIDVLLTPGAIAP
jgi:hypothetical protein